MYPSTTKIVKLLALVDLDLFYAKVKLRHIGFCLGKSENCILFGICHSHRPLSCLNIQIKELMKLNEYQTTRSLFDLG